MAALRSPRGFSALRAILAGAAGALAVFLLLEAAMAQPLTRQLWKLVQSLPVHNHYGLWPLVLVSSGLMSLFTVGYLVTPQQGRRDWRSLGLAEAFIVALYAEMYGFPLTVYLLSGALGLPSPTAGGSLDGHLLAVAAQRLWGVNLGVATLLVMAVSAAVMTAGFSLIYRGWRQIHRSGGELVTGDVYGWMRHPQYTGILLFTIGMLVHWPTLPTLLMWPVLLVTYYRLARKEEERVEATFGEAYREYRRQVGAFVPRFRRLQERGS